MVSPERRKAMAKQFAPLGACLVLLGLVGGLSAQGKAGAPTAKSPDGRRLITADGATICGYDVKTQKILFKIRAHAGAVTALAYSPDGKTIASGGQDKKVNLIDAASGKIVRAFAGHKAGLTTLAFAANGKTLTSIAADQTTIVWNLATGQVVKRFKKK
jgi:WD40 repeat protein